MTRDLDRTDAIPSNRPASIPSCRLVVVASGVATATGADQLSDQRFSLGRSRQRSKPNEENSNTPGIACIGEQVMPTISMNRG